MIQQYNKWLDEQKYKNPNRKFSVIFFNTKFSIFEYKKISDAPKLTDNRWDNGMTVYNPGYNSHIYNTLGCVLQYYQGVEKQNNPPGYYGQCDAKTRVVLFSNGQNLNQNKDIYTRGEIYDIVTDLKSNAGCDWRFNFIGLARSASEKRVLKSVEKRTLLIIFEKTLEKIF